MPKTYVMRFAETSHPRRPCSHPLIVVMQSTDFRNLDHLSLLGRLYRAGLRAIHGQRQMRTPAMVVVEICRIRSRNSWLIAGRPGSPRLSRPQCVRNRVRCQASTVAGCTKTRTSRQRAQRRASHDQKIRSQGRTWGRRIDR